MEFDFQTLFINEAPDLGPVWIISDVLQVCHLVDMVDFLLYILRQPS